MNYQQHIPKPPLSAFVDLFWIYEGYAPSHAKERLLPDGSVELIINLRDEKFGVWHNADLMNVQNFRDSIVCGVHSEYFVIDTVSEQSLVGIHFKPGGTFPFFKMPTDELHNLHLPLDTLWGANAQLLREQLLSAQTNEARFQILEQALLKRIYRPLERHPAVSFALRELRHARTIGDVTDKIGLSSRHFIQLFSQEVGLTPKLFWRIRRFQKVLRHINRKHPIEWTRLALTCGYFDQAHFIRDFQAFSGINPTTYLTLHTEHHNHVPLLD